MSDSNDSGRDGIGRHPTGDGTAGEYVPVRAHAADVPHFSVHADAGRIAEWPHGAPAPHTICRLHGEPDGAEALRDRIDQTLGWTAVVPRSGERVLVRRPAVPDQVSAVILIRCQLTPKTGPLCMPARDCRLMRRPRRGSWLEVRERRPGGPGRGEGTQWVRR
jgi:Zn-dependent metallo-hydrolase RNA specificity domain